MTEEERISATNGIWMCPTDADLIDKDEGRFTVLVLREWKERAEKEAEELLGKPSLAMLAIPRSPFQVPLSYQTSSLRQVFAALRREGQLQLNVRQLEWALSNALRDGVNPMYEPLHVDRVVEGLDALAASGEIEIAPGIVVLKAAKPS